MPSGFRCAFRWKRMIAAVTRPLSLPSTGPEYRWREARSRWRRLIQGSTGPCGRAVAEDGGAVLGFVVRVGGGGEAGCRFDVVAAFWLAPEPQPASATTATATSTGWRIRTSSSPQDADVLQATAVVLFRRAA